MRPPRKPPDDLARLSAQDPELRRALVELADAEAPSAAELRRMRQRLTVVFESPAPKHGSLFRLARGPLGRVLAGAVVLVGAIGLSRVVQPRAEVVDRPALPPKTEAASLTASAPPTAAAEPALSVPSPAPPAVPRSASTVSKPHHAHAPGAARSAPHVLDPAAVGGAVGGADTRLPVAAVPSAASEAIVAPSPAAPAASIAAKTPARAAPPARLTPVAASAAVSQPLDEAALLSRARQLASSDPDASLRLLAEHKRRFAQGMLSPEREVFAIELLRSLSRNEEAARRSQAFRRSFPGSVYLKRLER